MTPTEKVQKHVREVCGLMELKEGCEVIYHHNDGGKDKNQRCTVTWIRTPVVYGEDSNSKLTLSGIGDCHADEEEIEILGSPLNLQHYLQALRAKSGRPVPCTLLLDSIEIGDIQISTKTGNPATQEDYQKLAEIFNL